MNCWHDLVWITLGLYCFGLISCDRTMSCGVVQWRRLWCIGGALLIFHVQGKLSASLFYYHLLLRVLYMTVFNKHGKMSVDERSLENTGP